MTDQLVHISVRGPLRRMLTLLPLLLALTGAWFSVRWFVGNTIAENVSRDERGFETARLAVGLAPGDPVTHWTLAELEQGKRSLGDGNQALPEYERAVQLAPQDYRFWLALGRALEQSGDSDKGERAMRRAVELAPSYSYPRWYLGNLLLRNGHESEAFAELRRAGDADPQLRPQVFNLIWAVYGKDPVELGKAIGSTAESRAEFAKYLVDRREIDQGLNIWRALTATEKQDNRTFGEAMIKSAVEAKHYPQALEIGNDLALDEAGRGKVGQLFDGGFEQNTSGPNSAVFGWQVKSGPQTQVAIDPATAHGGTRSLRLIFKVRSNIDASVSQLVVVQPGTQYDLEAFVKTNKLESGGTPVVEVLDATDWSLVARSEPAPSGTTDWQRIAIAFKTGAKVEAIIIRINRASCGADSVCPIFGNLWYDDFDLKRRG